VSTLEEAATTIGMLREAIFKSKNAAKEAEALAEQVEGFAFRHRV
jgi:hypothetical protein